MISWRGLSIWLVGILLIFLFGRGFYLHAESIIHFPPTSWVEDHKGDCAVVLTGSSGRVREGFDLLSRGSVKKLVLSGVFPQARLREIFPEWPYYGRLDESDVILERYSKTTYGNAQQALALAEALKCHDVVLVTTQVHMHRALQTFRKVFAATDIAIYPRAVVHGSFPPTIDEWLPEAIKSVFYSLWAY